MKEKKKEPLICQGGHHCSNITQQKGHIIAPDTIISFNAP
jgi:hypothetical protein